MIGTLVKSDLFHTTMEWVLLCDDSNLIGNRNNYLPVDSLFLSYMPYHEIQLNGRYYFEIIKVGNYKPLQWYAKIIKKNDEANV